MQKTEKHCKNQCFCYHKTTKISPKTGPKTQKYASGPGHLRNRKKRCCKPKNWGQKVEKHGFFSLFACRFWTGAFTNRCLPYCFLQCFLKASVTTYQKQEVLAEKCPPPGKPVTFYECHPEDHAPAPSVRADLHDPIFNYKVYLRYRDFLLTIAGLSSGMRSQLQARSARATSVKSSAALPAYSKVNVTLHPALEWAWVLLWFANLSRCVPTNLSDLCDY